MKKGTFLMVFALIVAFSLPAFATTVTEDLRIVNTSALNPFEYRKHLDDDDLRKLAELGCATWIKHGSARLYAITSQGIDLLEAHRT